MDYELLIYTPKYTHTRHYYKIEYPTTMEFTGTGEKKIDIFLFRNKNELSLKLNQKPVNKMEVINLKKRENDEKQD